MDLAPEKIKEALIQGMKEVYAQNAATAVLAQAIKDATLAKVPDLDSILTGAQQASLNTDIILFADIANGNAASVINAKTNHPSHDWRRILEL